MDPSNGTGIDGTTNPGFDPLGAGDLNNMDNSHSDGVNQLTDWKKRADETLEHYLMRCPGTHGEPSTSTEHMTGQDNPSINVCSY